MVRRLVLYRTAPHRAASCRIMSYCVVGAQAWKYLNMHERAPAWERWDHEVKGWVDGKLVPIPVNIITVNRLFNTAIKARRSAPTKWKSHPPSNR